MFSATAMGSRIRERRATLGLTQADISQALQVSAQAVSKWERGESAPDISMLVPLARLLSISTDKLLGYCPPEAVPLAATTLASMPTPRYWLSTSVVDGKIHAIGGATRPAWQECCGTVEEYDPGADTWTARAPMPTARGGFATGVVAGKVYAVGGVVVTPRMKYTNLPTVERYDSIADTWTTRTAMPTARNGVCVSVVDGRIYAIGGLVHRQDASDYTALPTVERYDPEIDAWTTMAPLRVPVGYLATAVVEGRIYAIGGTQATAHDWSGISAVQQYDPAADAWVQKADLPAPRLNHGAAVLNGRVYVIGGLADDVSGPLYSTVEVYDPAADTWSPAGSVPRARCLMGVSVVGDKIHTVGGSTTTWNWSVESTVEEYDPGVEVEAGVHVSA